jgi:hypothetical protein
VNLGVSSRARWMIVAVLTLLGAAVLWLAVQALVSWITLD